MSSLKFFFLSFFIYLPYSISAFNITQILSEYPEFSAFNDQLTRTQLATTINSRRTITVLAVDNGAISGVSGMPTEELKKVLSIHVVLDYYDMQKFAQMRNNTRLLTTLFQSTGQAIGQQGFLNVTKTKNGVVFGSAVEGSGLNSNLMKSVVAQPYNVSVLQVSSVIVPPNLGNTTSSGSNSTASPPPAYAPGPSDGTELAPSPNEVSPTSDAPSSASPAPADAPGADAPVADEPAADAPGADAPGVDAPGADEPAADAPKKASSAIAHNYNYIGVWIGAIVCSLVMGVL